ncbi:hypothetical protein WMF18_17610 [Sorangium sp. So ce315]|uniref:hypothetical protein n=1 Tax=Sorangium sp. So ce315 TaxID=3133299 RepID=UPI003F5E0F98
MKIRSAIVLSIPLLALGCGRGELAPGSSSPTTPPGSAGGGEPRPAATAAPPGAPAPSRSEAPGAPGGAASPGATEVASGDPRIDRIRKRYEEIMADKGLEKSAFRLECPGGEGGGEVRLHRKDGAVSIAEVQFGGPGHNESVHRFYYDRGEVVFILYDTGGWSWDPKSTPDRPETISSTTQFRYYVHEDRPILCLKKHAKGSSREIDALLNRAPNEPDDCSGATAARRLAALVLGGEKASDDVKRAVCGRTSR